MVAVTVTMGLQNNCEENGTRIASKGWLNESEEEIMEEQKFLGNKTEIGIG